MIDFNLQKLVVEGHPGVAQFAAPGLGKTLTTLKTLEQLRDLGEVRNALILAPLRVCTQVWPKEIIKFGFDFDINVLAGNVKRRLSKPASFLEVCNIESTHVLEDVIGRYDMVIVDESYKYKNWTSKRTKSLRRMLPAIPRRMILTGTPTANGIGDIFSQIFICDDGKRLGKNVTVFRSRFMRNGDQNGPGGFWNGYKWVARDGASEEIIERISDIVLRTDESELDMPELIFNDILCSLPETKRREYNRLKRELYLSLETGDILAQNAGSAYQKCKQFANGAVYDEDRVAHEVHAEKLDAIADLVESLGGKQLLLFYNFKHDRDRVRARLKKQFGLDVPFIDGDAPKKSLEPTIDGWHAGKHTVLMAQVSAMSHGHNLQGDCCDVGYMGLPDSTEIFDQSFRRVHRQGAKHKHTRVHRFLTDGTVEIVGRDRVDGKFQDQYQFLAALKDHAATGLAA